MRDRVAHQDPTKRLLSGPIGVVNVGLEGFARELDARSVPVVQIDWSPPAGGRQDLVDLLEKLGR